MAGRGRSCSTRRTPRREATLDFHFDIWLAVSNAVAYAHDKGSRTTISSPANVMVGEFGEVLVVDWGLALDIRDKPEGPTWHRTSRR